MENVKSAEIHQVIYNFKSNEPWNHYLMNKEITYIKVIYNNVGWDEFCILHDDDFYFVFDDSVEVKVRSVYKDFKDKYFNESIFKGAVLNSQNNDYQYPEFTRLHLHTK